MRWSESDLQAYQKSSYQKPPVISPLEQAINNADPDYQVEKQSLTEARSARRSKQENAQKTKGGILPMLPKEPSEIVKEFDRLWFLLCRDLPEPVCEYKPFQDRRHELDRSWPDIKLVVEVEGWGHGMNNRYQTDLYKYNRLSFEGWTLLRCDRKILFDNPEPFFNMVRDCIERGAETE